MKLNLLKKIKNQTKYFTLNLTGKTYLAAIRADDAVCIAEGVACVPEGRAVPVGHEKDPCQQRERPRHLAGVQFLCGPRRRAGERATTSAADQQERRR